MNNIITAFADLHSFELSLLIFNIRSSWLTEIKAYRLLAVALQIKKNPVNFTTKTVKQSLLQFRSLQFVRLKTPKET